MVLSGNIPGILESTDTPDSTVISQRQAASQPSSIYAGQGMAALGTTLYKADASLPAAVPQYSTQKSEASCY
jgi:hypothetical protein